MSLHSARASGPQPAKSTHPFFLVKKHPGFCTHASKVVCRSQASDHTGHLAF